LEFACEHCDAGSLRIVAVTEKTVKVECLMCGQESTIPRREPPRMLVAKPHAAQPER